MKEEEGCENCIYYGGRNVDRWGNEDYICVHPYSDELDSSETGVCSGYVRVTEETPYLVKDDGWVYADPDEEELLEVMHDEVGPSNLDEYFDDDGMTKFRMSDKFIISGIQIGMILNTLWSVEELLEVMHDEVGPSNLDEYFDDDGNHIDISATCELIETILENKLDGAV